MFYAFLLLLTEPEYGLNIRKTSVEIKKNISGIFLNDFVLLKFFLQIKTFKSSVKKIFLLWLFVGISFFVHSQVLTIQDEKTKEPLVMVTLLSKKPKASAITNSQGQVEISAFKNAEKIEIRLLGYNSETMSYDELESLSFFLWLTPSILDLGEAVVSATRWNQPSTDIPSKITTVSPKSILLQNPQTAADLLSISGKVFIQKSQQGGGSPMIRGFATNRLIYVVDGVRMNTAIFRGGNIQNVISLDPFAAENTEVLFGPGSVIYGSDAIGGVMSFQTITPKLSLNEKPTFSGKVLTRFSSANKERTYHIDLNIGLKKWAFVTSVSSNDFDDLRMGNNGPDEYLRNFYVQREDSFDVIVTNDDPNVQRPSGYSQINLMQKVRYKPNENWDIQYGFHYSETSDYSRYDRHIRYKNGLPRYGEWAYGPQKWMMNNLGITHTSNNTFYERMTLRVAQQYFEESRIDRDINKFERHIRKEEVDAYSLNLDFLKSAGKNKLFYGFEAVYNDITSSGTDEDISKGISVAGPSRYPMSTWGSYAAYITDQFRLAEKILFQAGVRYNRYKLNADFDTVFYPFPFTKANLNAGALTGSVGVVYRPSDKWIINAGVASAFRSPNVDDVGKVFDSEAGSVVVPNPDLEAEYAWNADIGMTKVFDDVLKIDLAFYYTILKNALVRRNFKLNGLDSIVYNGVLSRVQAIQNASEAYVYGFQACIEFKLPSGFGLTSDFNYQKGEEELDDGTKSPLRHAAPWFGTSRLTYSVNNLDLQFYAVYSGEKKYEDMPEEEKGKPEIYAIDNEGNPWSPKWYTLNFKAAYRLTTYFSISAGLENITDKRYRPYSSGIAAAGRNFILSMQADF